MSGSGLAYHLRPNKAVDRELFLSFLSRLSALLKIETYSYIGLGGPFLEDFRLIHSRLGIERMICVEEDFNTHTRQKFNKPVNLIQCEYSNLEDYLDAYDFESPSIIWFDYTAPKSLTDQIERFTRTIGEVSLNSILRITLNANPSSLGDPDKSELAVRSYNYASGESHQTIHSWRLERLKSKLGRMFPSGLSEDLMTHKGYGKAILKVLRVAVEKEVLNHIDRRVIWGFSTHYSDGQPMVTVTILVVPEDDSNMENVVAEWSFSSGVENPLILDMPTLSTLERLTLEAETDPSERINYKLPSAQLGQDPVAVFKKFYRVYPQFGRVDL